MRFHCGYIKKIPTFAQKLESMAARFKLDEIDHKILDMLIENTRMPFTDIAKALEVSAGTVHIRVRKMEESGIIKSSTLTVDYDKIGYTFVA